MLLLNLVTFSFQNEVSLVKLTLMQSKMEKLTLQLGVSAPQTEKKTPHTTGKFPTLFLEKILCQK